MPELSECIRCQDVVQECMNIIAGRDHEIYKLQKEYEDEIRIIKWRHERSKQTNATARRRPEPYIETKRPYCLKCKRVKTKSQTGLCQHCRTRFCKCGRLFSFKPRMNDDRRYARCATCVKRMNLAENSTGFDYEIIPGSGERA